MNTLEEAPVQSTDRGSSGGTEWKSLGLADLSDHIIATHHTYLRRRLPVLRRLTERVVEEGGASIT